MSLHSSLDAGILDLDGTTVDTLGDFVAVLNAMLDDLSLPRTDAGQVRPLIGKGSEHLVRSVLHLVSATGHESRLAVRATQTGASGNALFDAALERYQHHYAAINGQYSKIFPGVIEGLEMLRARGLRLVCLTNKPTAFAVKLLEGKRLVGYFAHVFGGDAFERKKPDPLPLLKACEILGTAPARTLVLGDSSNDARAARAAGCPVWLVTYGYNHGEPVRAVDADGFLDSLGDIATLLGRHTSQGDPAGATSP